LPLVRLVPLTPLIEGLRAVMLEGASLASQSLNIGILLAWGAVTFALGIKLFRWN
jgi:ABC-type polysaccharide/polyol phosphate export permease